MSEDKQPFDIFREIEKLMREMLEKSDDPDNIPKVFGFAITRRDNMDPEIHRISPNIPIPPGMFGMSVAAAELHSELLEHEGMVYLTVDVGELDEDELLISCDDDLVTIQAKEKEVKEEILLPRTVKPEPVSKSLNNGVLELVFEVLGTEVDVEV